MIQCQADLIFYKHYEEKRETNQFHACYYRARDWRSGTHLGEHERGVGLQLGGQLRARQVRLQQHVRLHVRLVVLHRPARRVARLVRHPGDQQTQLI